MGLITSTDFIAVQPQCAYTILEP